MSRKLKGNKIISISVRTLARNAGKRGPGLQSVAKFPTRVLHCCQSAGWVDKMRSHYFSWPVLFLSSKLGWGIRLHGTSLFSSFSSPLQSLYFQVLDFNFFLATQYSAWFELYFSSGLHNYLKSCKYACRFRIHKETNKNTETN